MPNNDTEPRRMRMIVNGKAAADPALRTAVEQMRGEGQDLEVRVTWEGGDAARFAAEAVRETYDVVVIAGGDGTINEVVNGMVAAGESSRTAAAVVPYGTANDFAVGCGLVKGAPLDALRLAATGTPLPIDVGRVNDRHFINVAAAGFGAEVTAGTPKPMKKALGGVAYSIMGVVTAMKMQPYQARFVAADQEQEGTMLVMTVGNGRQTGGGYQIAPQALLDDGLLDLLVVHDLEEAKMGLLFGELTNLTNPENNHVSYLKLESFRIETQQPMQMNLDGEPDQPPVFAPSAKVEPEPFWPPREISDSMTIA
jgi:lipid kinase YegS